MTMQGAGGRPTASSGRGSRAIVAAAICALGLSCADNRPPLAEGSIDGVVLASEPVAGATVTAWHANDDGTRPPDPIAVSAPTGADGSFHLDVGTASGVVLLEAAGGTTVDAATSVEITLDADRVLRGAVLAMTPGEAREGEVVSAATHVAVALADGRLAAGKEATYGAALAEAYRLWGAHLGGEDPVDLERTLPRSVTDPQAMVGTAFTADVRYALALAGMSRHALLVAQKADPALPAESMNVYHVAEAWAADVSSQPDARFDGKGPAGAAISIGLCEPLDGCVANETNDCVVLCVQDQDSPRGDLSNAIGTFLTSSRNATQIDYALAQGMISAISHDQEPELFAPGGGPGPDPDPPAIDFVSPQAGATVAGTIDLVVTATDANSGVRTLSVRIDGDPAPADEVDAPERYEVTAFDTTDLADGPHLLAAAADDRAGNESEQEISFFVNNSGSGSISGVAAVARLVNADVTAYRYAGGVKGSALGSGSTDENGAFYLLTEEGYSGPVLIEAGGATASYREDAQPSATAIFDTDDYLRTVVPSFTDGLIHSGVVLTPLTSLAVALLEYRLGVAGGGATDDDVRGAWAEAVAELSDHFAGVHIDAAVPAVLDGPLALNEAVRYALLLASLSEMAVDPDLAAGLSFPSAVNAAKVWKAFEDDLGADGCFDGVGAGGVAVKLGPSARPFDSDTARLGWANAMVAYLLDVDNPTGIADPRDLADVLQALSASGPVADTTPDVCEPGQIFPDSGQDFDQTGPVVTWTGGTPPDGDLVRQQIEVEVMAVDLLSVAPMISFTAPPALAGLDEDTGPSVARLQVDTRSLGDGDLVITAKATDDSGNPTTASRSLVVDNTAPVLTVTGVTAGMTYSSSPVVMASQVDAHPGPIVATLDGATIVLPYTVSDNGMHTLVVSTTDLAGNAADTVTRSFRMDTQDPVITINQPVAGSWLGDNWTVDATAVDDDLATFAITAPAAIAGRDDDAGSIPHVGLSVDKGDVPDGRQTVQVVARDTAGHAPMQEVSVFVDTTAPTLAVESATPAGTYVAGKLTLTVLATDNLGAEGSLDTAITASATLDGVAITPRLVGESARPEGTRAITVEVDPDLLADRDGALVVTFRVTDQAGNAATAFPVMRTLDNTRPTIAVTGVTDGSWNKTNVSAAFMQNDANVGTTTATLDSAPFAGGVVSTEGQHHLQIAATDLAGNPAIPLDWTFYVDKTPPALVLGAVTPSGTNVKGTLTVRVTATDNLQAFDSLATAITVTASRPGGLSMTEARLADGSRQIDVTVITGTVGDGPFTLMFNVADQAGWPATALTVSKTIDNTPPIVTLSRVNTYPSGSSYDYWTSLPRPMLSGTVTEANPGFAVTVKIGAGAAQAVTDITSAGGSSWTWRFTPTADLLAGANTVDVTATDTASNPGSVSQTVSYDASNPTCPVYPVMISNEQAQAVMSYSSTGAPTYVALPVPDIPLTDADVGSPPGPPKVYKRADNLTAAGTNPIAWRITAGDVGSGVNKVEYQIQPPDGRTTTYVAASAATGGGTHVGVARSDLAPTDVADDLETIAGTYLIRFQVTDNVGRAASCAYDWRHEPIAPAVQIEKAETTGPTGLLLAAWLDAYDLRESDASVKVGLESDSGNSMTDLINGTATRRGLVWYRVRNRSTKDVYVGFFVPAPTSMTYTRIVRRSSASLGPTSPLYTGAGSCANLINGKFRIDGTLPTAYTCNGTGGWTAPPLDDDVSGSVISANFTSVGELVGEIRAWNDATMGTIGRCTTGGCATTEPASALPYFEFRIPAGSVTWVALYLDELSELSPSPTGVAEIRILGGATGPKQTGQVFDDWGWCHNASGMPPLCTDQEKERDYRAQVRASIAAQHLRGNVRVRPAPTATLLAHVPDPLASITDLSTSSLDFPSVLWRTCEGTLDTMTGACTDNLPDY